MLSFNNKTVLITGATGLIGSHIVDKLMAMGDVRVIALSRTEEKIRECFSNHIGNKRFSYVAQDVSEPINLPVNTAIDYIFHAAGPMERNVISSRPLDVIYPNLMGTINCAKLLLRQKENGINGRLVIFSSVTVYGNNTGGDITVTEIDSNVTERLENASAAYSQSKRMMEVIALAFHKQMGLDTVIARISTVYGYTKYLPDSAFFEFINKASVGEDITINNSMAAKRDNIYIDDAISALLCICQNGISGEAYNVSSNGEMGNFAAIDEIAEAIAATANELFGNQVKVHLNRVDYGKRAPGLMLGNEKLKQLGWKVNVGLIEGIKRTLESIQRGSE